jgi:hypothetical protein
VPTRDVEVGRRGIWRRGLAALVTALLVVSCAVSPTDGPPADDDAAAADTGDTGRTGDDLDEPDGSGRAPAADSDGAGGAGRGGEQAPTRELPTIEPPPLPATREELIDDVRALMDDALEEVGDVPLSVLVVDEHDREIVAHEPDRPLLPASTTKLVTAAAALLTLGANGRLPTSAETTGELRSDGVLTGDLLLIGSGDPVLVTDEYARWVYPARPATRLSELADAIVDAGVRRVEGDVVGISESFPGTRVPFGWPDEYFTSLDARYVDGLTVDAGLRTIVTFPEPEEDDTDTDTDADADADADADETRRAAARRRSDLPTTAPRRRTSPRWRTSSDRHGSSSTTLRIPGSTPSGSSSASSRTAAWRSSASPERPSVRPDRSPAGSP